MGNNTTFMANFLSVFSRWLVKRALNLACWQLGVFFRGKVLSLGGLEAR